MCLAIKKLLHSYWLSVDNTRLSVCWGIVLITNRASIISSLKKENRGRAGNTVPMSESRQGVVTPIYKSQRKKISCLVVIDIDFMKLTSGHIAWNILSADALPYCICSCLIILWISFYFFSQLKFKNKDLLPKENNCTQSCQTWGILGKVLVVQVLLYLIRFVKNISELIVTTCTYKGKCMGEKFQSWEQIYFILYCLFLKKKITVH